MSLNEENKPCTLALSHSDDFSFPKLKVNLICRFEKMENIKRNTKV